MTNLQVMTSSLGIPSHPVLKPPSDSFTLDLCVGHMMSGAQLYHNMLQVLSKNEPGLRDLGLDLRDLHTHITKIKDTGRLGDAALQNLPALTDTLHDDYQVQLAIHMVLLKLHSFCHDLMRSLRAIATYRLHPVASPSPSTT
ncbi:colony stimulating factor 3 (granulocyte) a [Synchiropus picturatus]